MWKLSSIFHSACSTFVQKFNCFLDFANRITIPYKRSNLPVIRYETALFLVFSQSVCPANHCGTSGDKVDSQFCVIYRRNCIAFKPLFVKLDSNSFFSVELLQVIPPHQESARFHQYSPCL